LCLHFLYSGSFRPLRVGFFRSFPSLAFVSATTRSSEVHVSCFPMQELVGVRKSVLGRSASIWLNIPALYDEWW
jgi:hypothetical protein